MGTTAAGQGRRGVAAGIIDNVRRFFGRGATRTPAGGVARGATRQRG